MTSITWLFDEIVTIQTFQENRLVSIFNFICCALFILEIPLIIKKIHVPIILRLLGSYKS